MHPLLFYSETCPYSRRIIETLRNTAHADKVLRLVCVDSQLDRIPSEIYQVPALVVPTSSGNQVVFDSALYEWLNSILRLEGGGGGGGGGGAPDAGGPRPEQHQGGRTEPPPPIRNSGPPADFMPDSDAFLCDLGGGADSASHLFAGAGEEIHLDYATPGDDTGGRRQGQGGGGGGGDGPKDDDVINRMMAARNEEISSLYAQIPRPM